jgi:hypothetical protein
MRIGWALVSVLASEGSEALISLSPIGQISYSLVMGEPQRLTMREPSRAHAARKAVSASERADSSRVGRYDHGV